MATCGIESSNGGHQDERASGCGMRSGFTLEVVLHLCLMWAELRKLEREDKVLEKDMSRGQHKSEGHARVITSQK